MDLFYNIRCLIKVWVNSWIETKDAQKIPQPINILHERSEKMKSYFC